MFNTKNPKTMKTNMSITSRIITVLFFSMMLITVTAQQRGETPPPPKSEFQQATPHFIPQPPQPPMEVELPEPPPPLLPGIPDLLPEQKEKIQQTNLKQLKAVTPLRNQIREKSARLNSLLTTQPVNLKETDQIADEIGQLRASILKLRIKHDQELRAILTPDQQIIFDAKPKPFLGKKDAFIKRR